VLHAQVDGGPQAIAMHAPPVGAHVLQLRLQQYSPAAQSTLPQGTPEPAPSALPAPASPQLRPPLQSSVQAHIPLEQKHEDGMH
jgi:hypothetical protein